MKKMGKFKTITNKIFRVTLAMFIVMSTSSLFSNKVKAVDYTVSIDGLTAAEVESNIQTAINGAYPTGTVTVTGTKTDESALVYLWIYTGVKVVWKAESQGLFLCLAGGGNFEVASTGKIQNSNERTIYLYDTTSITISDGEVTSTNSSYAIGIADGTVNITGGSVHTVGSTIAIRVTGNGNINITGGNVIADGAGAISVYAIYFNEAGTARITGGSVSAINATNKFAIRLEKGGLVAYLEGTVDGFSYVDAEGIIVKVDSLATPLDYLNTNEGMTRVAGAAISSLKWKYSSGKTIIASSVDPYSVIWGTLDMEKEPDNIIVEYPVRVITASSTVLYKTLKEAVDVANLTGAATIEIIGKVEEVSNVNITSNVTIIGAEGSHSVNTGNKITISEGANVVFGNGLNTNYLIIRNRIEVTNGTVKVFDGQTFNNSMFLNGPNVKAEINGGVFIGSVDALSIAGGAVVSKISGGAFIGVGTAIHMTDATTRIEEITDGFFLQTSNTVTLHGQAIFMQNDSTIGKISGGHFESTKNSAIGMTRGAWIDEISGGEFVANFVGSYNSNPALDTRNATVWIEGETSKTGIGTISGGHFSGAYFGVLAIQRNFKAQIDSITGGLFEGVVGLQCDANCEVTEISGGQLKGTLQGLLNVGKIGKITGDVEITGSDTALWNYQGATIQEISGGYIANTGSGSAMSNYGVVDLISGGTFIGGFYAINCVGFSAASSGRLNKISGGVFLARTISTTTVAIRLYYNLLLEPSITGIKGIGRYQSTTDNIFNNLDLVQFPDGYLMSTATEPVTGINEVEFRYLVRDANDYELIVVDSYATETGAGIYTEASTVTINAGNRPGYTFVGWTTDLIVASIDDRSATTTLVMPASNLTATANWQLNTDSPNTGDNSNIKIAISLVLLSFICIVITKKSKKIT